jgi:serine/threonine-protein kinase
MSLEREIGSRFAGYRIEALLGRGGMGVVYRGSELAEGRPVALKLLRPEVAADPVFSARFEREARLTAQLTHPHIVPLLAAGEFEGVLYLAMAYIDGIDLAGVIADRGRLHPRPLAAVVRQVAAGLDAAAALGLVHRDVKPSNVLLEDRQGKAHAYLADFGVSKHVSSQSGLTSTGVWVGTLDYAAPEQVQSQPVDPRTDVYALGCLLHQGLTGQVPFPRARDVDKLMAHIAEPPPRPADIVPGLPRQFDEVVGRAMAKAPEDRFASAGDLASAALAAAGLADPAAPEASLVGRRRSAAVIDREAPTAG